jgi:cytochrome c5
MVRKIPLLLVTFAFACGDASAPREEQQEESEMASDAGVRDSSTRDTSTRDVSTTHDANAARTDEEEADAGFDASGNDAGRSDAGSGDDCDAVSYDAFGEAFFETYCSSCHAKMEPTFNDLSEIEPNLEDIRERVIDPPAPAMQMPPSGFKQPSAADKMKLDQWIECGAP